METAKGLTATILSSDYISRKMSKAELEMWNLEVSRRDEISRNGLDSLNSGQYSRLCKRIHKLSRDINAYQFLLGEE